MGIEATPEVRAQEIAIRIGRAVDGEPIDVVTLVLAAMLREVAVVHGGMEPAQVLRVVENSLRGGS